MSQLGILCTQCKTKSNNLERNQDHICVTLTTRSNGLERIQGHIWVTLKTMSNGFERQFTPFKTI